jgi:DNA-binding NtrC family response regulator
LDPPELEAVMTSRHLRILVVEDETLIRWSIAETLGQEGHTVREAANAASAMKALEDANEDIDVVLLDCRLPDSSDLGLLANVRRLQPRSAVVMMTAYGTPEMTEGALALGAYRVVDKPFDMRALESLVVEAHDARPH